MDRAAKQPVWSSDRTTLFRREMESEDNSVMTMTSSMRTEKRTDLWAVGLAALAIVLGPMPAEGAPLRWRWSNPKPHGGNVVDMAYSPYLGLAVQVAERGQIFTSVDLKTWVPRESGTTNDLRAVTFMGARVIVTGEAGRVLYSDGGVEFLPGTITPPTSDWLEAVVASPQMAVAVGDNGAVYASTNGIHWKRYASGTTAWLRGVTHGTNGGFVAVGEGGKIISSSSGTNNWMNRASGLTVPFNRVAFSAGRYTAVADSGNCKYSTDGGITWQAEVTGAVNDLFHSGNNDKARLAVGDYEVRMQETGGPWTDEFSKSNAPTPWTYYCEVGRPDYFLAAGRTGLMEEALKTNGLPFYWLPLEGSPRSWLWDVTNPTNLYVAVGDRATVMTSANGGEWKLEVVPPAVTNSIFLGVGGSTNLLVAVGNQGSLMISPNVYTNVPASVGFPSGVTNGNAFGVLWYAMPVPTSNDLQGVFVSSNLTVVTGGGGTILTSPDGTNWTSRLSPTALTLTSVCRWTNGWVATGDDGAIVVSTNGANWNLVPPTTTNWLYRVRYLGDRLVAVGQNGTIMTSTNGTSWVKRTSGTTRWLNDVARVDGRWYAIGNSGAVLVSSNLTSWADLGTITRKNLYGAASDGIQLVMVGLEGSIIRAQVTPSLAPIRILAYDRLYSTNAAAWQNLYLFGGQPDQRFTLDYRLDFEAAKWVIGPLLDFFDGSGTLFYLETFSMTNLPPHEYYRATLVP